MANPELSHEKESVKTAPVPVLDPAKEKAYTAKKVETAARLKQAEEDSRAKEKAAIEDAELKAATEAWGEPLDEETQAEVDACTRELELQDASEKFGVLAPLYIAGSDLAKKAEREFLNKDTDASLTRLKK